MSEKKVDTFHVNNINYGKWVNKLGEKKGEHKERKYNKGERGRKKNTTQKWEIEKRQTDLKKQPRLGKKNRKK